MKKIFLIIIIFLVSVSNVKALTIEEQLNELKTNINKLQSSMNDIKDNTLDKTYPVGSIYITTVYSTSSQVSEALGGTWEAYSSGKTLVGVDSSDETFNTVGKEGGNSTTTLSTDNLPSHTHGIPVLSGTAASDGAHTHSIPTLSGTTNSAGAHTHTYNYMWTKNTNLTRQVGDGSGGWWPTFHSGAATGSDGSHTHTVTTKASTSGSAGSHTHTVTTKASTSEVAGSGTSFTNLQPYITVYMWKRMA